MFYPNQINLVTYIKWLPVQNSGHNFNNLYRSPEGSSDQNGLSWCTPINGSVVNQYAIVVTDHYTGMTRPYMSWALLPDNHRPKVILLQWSHNESDGVYSGADQRKHQSSASLAFVRGIHRSPVNSPHKRPVRRNMFPFDDVIILKVRWHRDLDKL